MKIKSLEIIGLNGSEQPINLTFNEDLNIITGRNGSGKTTILKIIWYFISGNTEIIFDEIKFKKILIETELYKIILSSYDKTCIFDKYGNFDIFDFADNIDELNKVLADNKIKNITFLCNDGKSIFFPTYRRIESTSNLNSSHKKANPINEALDDVSMDLSNENHHFIAHVGIKDIENLLFKKYTEISEDINQQQDTLNKQLLEKISQPSDDEIGTLKKIKQQIEALQQEKELKMKPFTSLKKVLQKFFRDKNVNIGDMDIVSLGNPQQRINSSLLSAGEKQMLSFLVYNAFYEDTIFIIDEPEINLHVDWQRQLLPALLKQGTTNQFIVATHSPFIYGKYPDKEIQLHNDKGDTSQEHHQSIEG